MVNLNTYDNDKYDDMHTDIDINKNTISMTNPTNLQVYLHMQMYVLLYRQTWSLLVNGGKQAHGRVSMRGLWDRAKCILDVQVIKNIIKIK